MTQTTRTERFPLQAFDEDGSIWHVLRLSRPLKGQYPKADVKTPHKPMTRKTNSICTEARKSSTTTEDPKTARMALSVPPTFLM